MLDLPVYVRKTPPGIWAASEFLILAIYDQDPCLEPVFLCHESPKTHACRGWVGTHGFDCVAVRLAVALGKIRAEDVPADPDLKLYRSGTAAMNRDPSREAKAHARGIERRRTRGRRG